jgi:hypothetical protein
MRIVHALVKVALSLLVPLAAAQTTAELERRLAELEKKLQQIDPTFRAGEAGLAERLEAAERKIEQILSSRLTAAAPPPLETVPVPETPAALTRPLQRVSVTGDYQASEDSETRLPLSGYMDFHFNKLRSEPGQLDFHRFVLLFGHSFSSRIKFWSELELEHAFVEGREEKGELELEQAYVDFLIKPYFNFRAGMLLTPVGIMNERHEPPSFNGVERPAVETFIIPSTWFDSGFGITGELGRGFRYRAYLMSGLDASGFDAEEGIREGRQKGFLSSWRNPAKTVRVEWAGLPRLTLGASGYTGHAGFNLRSVNPRVDLFSFDGRYGFRRLDFRGLFAQVSISRARELNRELQQQLGFSPNIARQLRGWYVEPAAHLFPRRLRQDMIVFTRYEKFNTQHRMPAGLVPLPQFNRSAWVLGATYKPNADVALKFDYIFNRNKSTVVSALDSVNLGIGWWF